MKLTGYSSSVFVRPGGSLGFHVHSESPNVDVQLVRLLHGDENPRGPGFQEREISSSIDGRHAAGPQEIFRGSFAELETTAQLIERDDFEIDLWIWPTRPEHRQPGHHLLACARMPRRALPCAGGDRSGRRAKRNAGDRTLARAAGASCLGAYPIARTWRPVRAFHHASRLFPALRASRTFATHCTPRVSCSGDI